MRKNFFKFQRKLPILFSFTIVLIIDVLEIIIMELLIVLKKDVYTRTLEYFIAIIIILLVVYFFVGSYIFSKTNLKKSIKIALPFVLVYLGLSGISFYTAITEGEKFKDYLQILEVLFTIFVLVVREELIYRGVVCSSLLLKKEINERQIIKIIILDGILFGALHILNGTLGIPFKAIMVQVFSSCFFGMLEATLYLKSRNIYIPIIVHFGNNFVGAFDMIFIDSNVTFKDMISNYGETYQLFEVLIHGFIYISIIYWFFLRKGKIKVLVKNAQEMKKDIYRIKEL